MDHNHIVNAYVNIRERIKEQREIMKALKFEENRLIKELRDYLNQSETPAIRIDDNTLITMTTNQKKIVKSGRQYSTYLVGLLESVGLSNSEDLAREIINGKTETIVQQQRLKIIKTHV